MAHQWAIRQRMAESTAAPLDIRDSVVRPISREAAVRVITLFEPMPAIVTHTFGLFFGDTMAAVCCFGPHYLANIRAQPGCIALLRGACLPQAPRNSGSRLIRGAMRQLQPQYRVVTAFADALHGERGAIYQAAGFAELGPSSGGRRVFVHHQGKVLSDRGARRRFGTSSAPRLAAMGLRVETTPRRTRYLCSR
jgi:hypothetical protein